MKDAPVIVGVDGSASSVEAAEMAADDAGRRNVNVVLLHVGPADARVFERVLTRGSARNPGVGFTTRHVPATGVPATDRPVGDALAAAAAGASLLVVGHRAPAGRRVPAATSVAQRLVDVATVPTIVHKRRDPACSEVVPHRIVAGVATAHGRPDAILEFAVAEAARRQAVLDVICAGADLDPAIGDALERWLEKYPEVNGHLHHRPGIDPAIALLVESHAADLVIVGTASAAAAASVAHALVHRAGCPVAVIPG